MAECYHGFLSLAGVYLKITIIPVLFTFAGIVDKGDRYNDVKVFSLVNYESHHACML